jgi:hypothetical protein
MFKVIAEKLQSIYRLRRLAFYLWPYSETVIENMCVCVRERERERETNCGTESLFRNK